MYAGRRRLETDMIDATDTLTAVKPDLEAIWDAHCRYEFETRDLEATMATMVTTAGTKRQRVDPKPRRPHP